MCRGTSLIYPVLVATVGTRLLPRAALLCVCAPGACGCHQPSCQLSLIPPLSMAGTHCVPLTGRRVSLWPWRVEVVAEVQLFPDCQASARYVHATTAAPAAGHQPQWLCTARSQAGSAATHHLRLLRCVLRPRPPVAVSSWLVLCRGLLQPRLPSCDLRHPVGAEARHW